MPIAKAPSLTAAAFTRLRADILACRLIPGQKLVISDICDTLGFSLGAVREALSRLTSEGLVLLEPHKGFRVAPIPSEELRDITNVRILIECQCLERAIELGGVKWEAAIVSTLFELSRVPLQNTEDPDRVSEDWVDTHKRFHEALVAACDSPWMLKIRQMLYAQSERYRTASVPLNRALRDINAEHEAIANATISRNKAAATAAMRDHLGRTTQILIDSDLARQASA